MPFAGILPLLTSNVDNFDLTRLQILVTDYAATGASKWNVIDNSETNNDIYQSGKSYGKMAEIIAIARLDPEKYFVYDKEWSTLLGMQESFLSDK